MKCCAILVNYHGATDTAAAVRSALTDFPSLEVVVVDNSMDATEHAKLKQLLPAGARLFAAPQNLGFGRACNLAFSMTAADFIFLINPDVRIMPGCTSALLDALEKDEQLGAVAPIQFLDDACHWRLPPSWFPTALRAWATDTALRDRISAKRLSYALRAEALRYWTAQQPVTQRALSGGAALVRRTAIDAYDYLFDPRFFMYFEDSDLCQRIKQGGRRLAMVPQAVVVHRWRNQPHKAAMMADGAAIYFDKHGGATSYWWQKAIAVAKQPVLTPLLGAAQLFPECGLDIPPAWQDGWVLELSPSPLISPSIGLLGAGAKVGFPDETLAHFEGDPVFGRLGPTFSPTPADNCRLFEFNVGPSPKRNTAVER